MSDTLLDRARLWEASLRNTGGAPAPGVVDVLRDLIARARELEAERDKARVALLGAKSVIAHETQMREAAEARAVTLSETRTRLLAKHPHELCKFQREEARREGLRQGWGEGFERAHSQHYAEDLRLSRRTPAIVIDNPYEEAP